MLVRVVLCALYGHCLLPSYFSLITSIPAPRSLTGRSGTSASFDLSRLRSETMIDAARIPTITPSATTIGSLKTSVVSIFKPYKNQNEAQTIV